MSVVAIIPARGGSKGVPRKNVRPLAGKPLVVYSIEAALHSGCADDVVVSTDDREIATIAAAHGAQVIERPKALSGDEAMVMDAVRYTLEQLKEKGCTYEIVVLLEPTAPLRTAADIDAVVSRVKEGADSAATFSETRTPPTRIWQINGGSPEPYIEGTDPFLPRQMQDTGYFLNGMVYAVKTAVLDAHEESQSFLLGKSEAVVIPRERVVDIDTEQDFYLAEAIIKRNKKQ